jgi:S-DNA-T family DNA segregation ATPase FtsK/SpoIIIE
VRHLLPLLLLLPLVPLSAQRDAKIPDPDPEVVTAAIEADMETPLLVLVDDAETLVRQPVDAALEAALTFPGRRALALAGKIDDLASETRGFVPKAKRSKYGLLLSPNSTLQGDLIGLRLQRSQLGKQVPGRGLFSDAGEAVLVQVPHVTGP